MDDLRAILAEAEAVTETRLSMVEDQAFRAELASALEHGWAKRVQAVVPERFRHSGWPEAMRREFVTGRIRELRDAIGASVFTAAQRAFAEVSHVGREQPDLTDSTIEDYHFVAGILGRAKVLRESGVRIAAEAHDPVMLNCLEPTDALRRTRIWFEKAPCGSVLAMVGGTGVGKTVAAAWALCERGGAAVRSDELAFLSGSNYSADRERFRELVSAPGLLVVDDVGTERDEAKARHGLFDLVDIRQGKGMRTILTSNLTADALKARLCERTLSRLRAVGGIYSCGGDDMRGAKP